MSPDEHAHDLWMAEIGDEYEATDFVVTEEMLDRHTWSNDDYNPWYLDDSPFGGRIAPPNFLIPQTTAMFYGHYKSHGALHTKEEYEYINPVKIGQKLRMTGKLVNKYHRRGRDYFVSEFLVMDEDGKELVRMRIREAAPVTIPSGDESK